MINYQAHARSAGKDGRSNGRSYLSDDDLPEGGFPFVIISHEIRRASNNSCVDILLINVVSSCSGLVKKKLREGGMKRRDS